MIQAINRRQPTGRGTQVAIGKDAKLLDPMSWSGTMQQSPSLAIETDVADVTERLNEMASLEAEWDDEDAASIDPDAVRNAKALLDKVALSAQVNEYIWQRPSVAPLRNGGVTLSWRLLDHRLVVYFLPNDQRIVFVNTMRGQEPIRRDVSLEGARDRILMSLSCQ